MRHIIITIMLYPALTQGQTFQQAVMVGPNFSYYSSSDTEVWPTFIYKNSRSVKYVDFGDFGGSLGYKLAYHFPKALIIGTSLEYLHTKAIFNTRCYCNHPMDRNINISNSISIHSIDIPLYFKFKTNAINCTYLNGGIGISALFYAYRKVENITYFLNINSDPIRTEIANESFTLRNTNNNGLGTFYYLGIGQCFRIKKINFFTELSYRQDINSWTYITAETPDGVKEFPIKRHGINLKIGMILHQSNKKAE